MSPCENCTRVKDPADCDNKLCRRWQKWFLARWALIHGMGLKLKEEQNGLEK